MSIICCPLSANAIPLMNQLEAARTEIDRMRPVVEAAERYRDHGPACDVICKAVDAYRAARDRAVQCIGTIRTQPSNVECIACGKFGQACDRTRKP